jgi:hypothetical protein
MLWFRYHAIAVMDFVPRPKECRDPYFGSDGT